MRASTDAPTSTRPSSGGAAAGWFWKAGSGNPTATSDATWNDGAGAVNPSASVSFSNSERLTTYTGIVELWVEGGQQYLKQDYANTLTVSFDSI